MANESQFPKRQVFRITPGKPLELVESDAPALSADPLREAEAELLKATVLAYLTEIRRLASNELRAFAGFVPQHLFAPVAVWMFRCPDGMIVRTDPTEATEDKVRIGMVEESIGLFLPRISESVLVRKGCPLEEGTARPGVSLTIRKTSPLTGKTEQIAEVRPYMSVGLDLPPSGLHSLRKPFKAVSATRDSFAMLMQGELYPDESPTGRGRALPFLVRFPVSLPVGWSSIEVYPGTSLDHWKPEAAASWAETDILAYAAKGNLARAQLRALDPFADGRNLYASLLGQLETLLSAFGREEDLQQFLTLHPELVCPSYRSVRPKLAFGARATDFVFLDARGDYLLVEIERPDLPLLRADGQQSEKLTHALNQVLDWRRYIEDNLRTVQRELGLPGMTACPRAMIVIGRSTGLDEQDRRKLQMIESAHPTIRVLTYDDLVSVARKTIENLVGPLWIAAPPVEIYYNWAEGTSI